MSQCRLHYMDICLVWARMGHCCWNTSRHVMTSDLCVWNAKALGPSPSPPYCKASTGSWSTYLPGVMAINGRIW